MRLVYLAFTLLLSFSPSAEAIPTSPPSNSLFPIDISALSVQNVTFGHSSTSKRADTPPECSFLGPREGSFAYIQLTLAEGYTSCVGWSTSPYLDCGAGPWAAQDYTDLYSAVQQQCAQDGTFKTSKVGRWIASFFLLNSAFSNREAWTLFYWAVEIAGYGRDTKHGEFYFSYDSDFLRVHGDC
ncbi:hypothetical protein VTL71DRAFT_2774 [Oculimacula yallundae]|uniref:Uncharacterized protein n=1 Tax=Oculimacula yallundae TaxID=86028 RepID=A0ABR4CAL1_9HELO